MNEGEFAEKIGVLWDQVYDYKAWTSPKEQKAADRSINKLLKTMETAGTGLKDEEVEETRKAYSIAMRDGTSMNAADWFFSEFFGEFNDDTVEALNALRRATFSLFRIDEKNGDNYGITDTKTAATFALRVVDDPEMPKSGFFIGCIVPAQDGVWQPFGGVIFLERDGQLEKQAGIAQKKQGHQLEIGNDFKEYFGSRIKAFPTGKECEKEMNEFMLWRTKKLIAGKERGGEQPLWKAPSGIPEPFALFETYEGTAFSPFFKEYSGLVAGKEDKETRVQMISDVLKEQTLFPDPVFRILYEERESELLALSKEAYADVGDSARLRELVLYLRPALFDAVLPRITLFEDGEMIDDMWGSNVFGKGLSGTGGQQGDGTGEDSGKEPDSGDDEGGTGYSGINDANREEFYPILEPIESAIAACYRSNPKLKDKDVIEALKNLRDTYGRRDGGNSPLERGILEAISPAVEESDRFNTYDVIMCLRCLLGSAKLHHQEGGSRGYLDFIKEYV